MDSCNTCSSDNALIDRMMYCLEQKAQGLLRPDHPQAEQRERLRGAVDAYRDAAKMVHAVWATREEKLSTSSARERPAEQAAHQLVDGTEGQHVYRVAYEIWRGGNGSGSYDFVVARTAQEAVYMKLEPLRARHPGNVTLVSIREVPPGTDVSHFELEAWQNRG